MNECNSGLPSKVRIFLGCWKRVVDAVTPRERVQQRSAEKIGDVPQSPEETVEVVKTALQELISERSEAIEVPKISRQRSVEVVKTARRTVEHYLDVSVEVDKVSFRNGFPRVFLNRAGLSK